MVLDPSVRAALETALAANPDDIPVRLHLAGLLAGAGDAGAALAHCTTVLAEQPDNQEALRLAAAAARELGDARAAGYERLLGALQAAAPTGQ
ncbi:MAG TPA: hypothetical protein VHA57_04870, partial [Actinomycetota bacterium]|nr:hypothetical protein [Actinomycetota bacterium]